MKVKYTSLTQNQKLLWVGQQLNPDSPIYNMVMTFEIKDNISIPHFKLAFKKLIEKSDALRSIFKIQDGELKQYYLNELEYDLEFIDLSNKSHPKEAYKAWEEKRINYKFNLEECAFDCALIKLSESCYTWYINQYHLISDGWSTAIIFNSMSEFYRKALQDKLNNIEMLPSYQDFVSYSEKVKEDSKNKDAFNFWNKKQSTFPAIPALYNKEGNFIDTASVRLNLKLGKERSDKIRGLANQKGVRVWSLELTFYNIFLTTLFAFINRVTGQEHLVIGSPTHNRTEKQFKNTIGYFVETFPLSIELNAEETFFSLLKKVQIESNSFLKYAQVGTSTSQLNRGFNVFYNYMNTVYENFSDSPVTTSWVHSGHHDPRHHIRFHVHDFNNSGDFHVYLDLNTKIFNAEEQKQVPQHFLKLLDAFIENHNQQIDEVSLITEFEALKIKQWNNTTVEYSKNETLLTKFKTQSLKTSNNIALVFEKESLTYKLLDEKSNQVAHFLINNGINKNDIITVSLNRSLEMMIYIYGIIKAGAAYLPLEINTPLERLKFILKDTNSKIIFYNHKNLEEEILKNFNCLHVKTIDEQISSQNVTSPETNIKSDDLAYVIYTSGSTGEPKGVKCHHGGICNRLNWMDNDYPITINDTFLQKTPITFDVSLWELFWPLQKGAKLIVEIPDGHKNPEKLIGTIKQHQVTNIHFVPSMLNVFIQTYGVDSCNSLKRIFCSGEALSVPVVKSTYDKLNVEVHNLYGPTEASVDVTSWHCKKENLSNGVPIGRPVANTKLYILDKKLNQLPIGTKGELYIAGKQVAKGYLNRDALTKKSFVKDIFSDNPNAKMYKTGDLARYRSDGVIEYHGRIDNQIKIRGLRIELGEIEKNIEKFTFINQAIVIVDEQDNLVAYYTGEYIKGQQVMNTLAQKLPEYMIPQFYVHLKNFEFLSSGKVNRKKLHQWIDVKKTQLKETKIQPRNEIEEIILGVWKEVLAIEKIGVHENFIRIGGNSLNAISITSRLKDILELDVSITDVFNFPTIASYSEYVENTITELLNK